MIAVCVCGLSDATPELNRCDQIENMDERETEHCSFRTLTMINAIFHSHEPLSFDDAE